MRDLPGVYITGIGTRLGSDEVSSDEIGARFNMSGKRLANLQRKCGPERLFRYGSGESLENCALDSCRTAMSKAGLAPEGVSGIYASTGGPVGEYALPDLARVIALRLGLDEIDTAGVSV